MVVGDTGSPRFVKPGALIRIWGPRTLGLPLVANADITQNAATPVKSIFRFYLKKIKLTKCFRPADTVQPCVGLICIELGCQSDGKRS